jgi:ATP-dependent protease Clp ATPase subunit
MENKEFNEVSPYGPLYEEIIAHFDETMIGQSHAKHIVASYLANTYSDIYDKKGPI